MGKYVGKETSRVDGAAKVTGKAKYAAEFTAPNMAYGFIVSGEIAKGKITGIDAGAAEKSAGVIKVTTHENTPRFFSKDNPAIANAVYHATGRRVRDLPITLDKLL